MEEKSTKTNDPQYPQLKILGAQIRAQRKALRLNATVTAEAAGVSRVTLHRIEKGEASVTMGAWCNTLTALGMALQVRQPSDSDGEARSLSSRAGWIPARIPLADYPQLRSLAWQVHGTNTLTPAEAFDIYERNTRHLDTQTMSAEETALLDALRLAFSLRPEAQEGANHVI